MRRADHVTTFEAIFGTRRPRSAPAPEQNPKCVRTWHRGLDGICVSQLLTVSSRPVIHIYLDRIVEELSAALEPQGEETGEAERSAVAGRNRLIGRCAVRWWYLGGAELPAGVDRVS